MLTNMYTYVVSKLSAFRREERGAVDIVAIVVMIGIAVALAVVFKDQIGKMVKDLITSISGTATTAATGAI